MGIEEENGTPAVWGIRVLGLPSTTSPAPSRCTLQVTNRCFSLSEVCQDALHPDPVVAEPYLSTLATHRCANQNDMLLVVNSLLASLSSSVHPNAAQIEHALLVFLARHSQSLEGLNIVSQVVRLWSERFIQSSETRTLLIGTAVKSLGNSPEALPCGVTDPLRAYALVLTRALEAPVLREAASRAIEVRLRTSDPQLKTHCKALAGNVLQTLRHAPDYPELRRLASLVFTTGVMSYQSDASRLSATEQSSASITNKVSEESAILEKLHGPGGIAYSERLTPNDFQQLRQLRGLSLELFRVITERIRLRATSEPWARTAILDLARAPHTPEVTTSIRTAALGALVSEARRLGRLTPQIENEIFAVSAEIPTLLHVREAVSSAESEHQSPSTPEATLE